MSSHAPSRPRPERTLTDAEWLQSQASNVRLAASLREAAAKGDTRRVAKAWRTRLKPLRKLDLVSSLRWSADPTIDGLTIDALDELRHGARRKKVATEEVLSGMVESWLERQPPQAIPSLLDQLLACSILIDYSAQLTDGILVRLWRFVEERAGQVSGATSRLHPAVRELLTVEMQFQRLVVCSSSPLKSSDTETVLATVRQFLGTFTDERGRPFVEWHESIAAAMSSLGRLHEVFEQLDLKWIDAKDRRRLERLVETAVLLFPTDCHWVPSRTPHEALDWMRIAMSLAGPQPTDVVRRMRKHWDRLASEPEPDQPSSQRLRTRKRPPLKEKQLVSHQSDAARYALLHGDWRESRDRCIVRYDETRLALEVDVRGQLLLQGDWQVRVTAGGEDWTSGAWSCCCWYSDAEADFCELKCQVAPHVTVYRQLLWARQEQFLVVADEVRAPGVSGLAIESQLPLVAGWKSLSDGRTREWQLQQGNSVVRVLPIFCAQEKVNSTDGQLSCDSHTITIRSGADQTSVYNATVIDWNPQRTSAPVLWGRLSVAEDGQRVPPSLASAARWRMGDQVWMVFHQPEKGDSARSALGLHTHHETVIARACDGEYHMLVEVE